MVRRNLFVVSERAIVAMFLFLAVACGGVEAIPSTTEEKDTTPPVIEVVISNDTVTEDSAIIFATFKDDADSPVSFRLQLVGPIGLSEQVATLDGKTEEGDFVDGYARWFVKSLHSDSGYEVFGSATDASGNQSTVVRATFRTKARRVEPATPVCGRDNLLLADQSLQSIDVTAKLEDSIARVAPVANTNYPTDGDNIFPVRLRASDSPGCGAVEFTDLSFRVMRMYDPDQEWVMHQFEVRYDNGQRLGTLTTSPSGHNNGDWVYMEYAWHGSIIIDRDEDWGFNLICTNCGSLPAHTTFYIESNYLNYRAAGDTMTEAPRYWHEPLSRLVVYGHNSNIGSGPVCSTIIKPNRDIVEVTSKIVPMLASDTPEGAAVPAHDQLVQVVNLLPNIGSSCNGSKVSAVAFQVSSTRSLNGTYWTLKDHRGAVLATATFNSLTPQEALVGFFFIGNLEVPADLGQLPQVRLFVDSSSFTTGDMLSVKFNASLTWTDTVLGNTYTAAVDLSTKTLWY